MDKGGVMNWNNVVEINKENFGLLLNDYLDQRKELADLKAEQCHL